MRLNFLLALIVISNVLFAQAPALIPYQAIARNAAGEPLASSTLSARFTIHDLTATGANVWQELQTVTTSSLGLFTVQLGSSVSLSSVNWATGAKFMQVEINLGQGFVDIGTQQLLSVPYALYAGTSGSSTPGPQGPAGPTGATGPQGPAGNGFSNGTATNQLMYWNGSAWVTLNPGSVGQVLTLCSNGLVWTTGGICPGSITTFNCAGATNQGTLIAGTAASGVSSTIAYTGGNGGAYSAQSIASTGVTGLTATLTAGTLASGAGSITYTITGTPSASGTASFALSLGGQSCALSLTVNGTGGTGPLHISTALIPAGTFTMGSPTTEPERQSDEVQHQVTLSAFRMSTYEITNAQYATFLNANAIGANGLYTAGAYPTQPLIYDCGSSNGLTYTGSQWQSAAGKENFPVICVTWYGAAAFATYAGGRLPTEAEWEYACRAGTTTPFNTGNCLDYTQANYYWPDPYSGCSNANTNYPGQTQAVDSYAPNAFGLYNMHGNVWEWCSDWYGAYGAGAQTNPTGPSTGTDCVLRGGCWFNSAQYCRSADRLQTGPGYGNVEVGFRLAFLP
jgi:formylglycine-generating enzyme required for sulfatase activity